MWKSGQTGLKATFEIFWKYVFGSARRAKTFSSEKNWAAARSIDLHSRCCRKQSYFIRQTQIACKVRLHKGGLYSRMSFNYKYKTSPLTPFGKPCDIINLTIQKVFYIQLYVESTFTYYPVYVQMGWPWNSLVQGDEQPYQPKSQTCMEWCHVCVA